MFQYLLSLSSWYSFLVTVTIMSFVLKICSGMFFCLHDSFCLSHLLMCFLSLTDVSVFFFFVFMILAIATVSITLFLFILTCVPMLSCFLVSHYCDDKCIFSVLQQMFQNILMSSIFIPFCFQFNLKTLVSVAFLLESFLFSRFCSDYFIFSLHL